MTKRELIKTIVEIDNQLEENKKLYEDTRKGLLKLGEISELLMEARAELREKLLNEYGTIIM